MRFYTLGFGISLLLSLNSCQKARETNPEPAQPQIEGNERLDSAYNIVIPTSGYGQGNEPDTSITYYKYNEVGSLVQIKSKARANQSPSEINLSYSAAGLLESYRTSNSLNQSYAISYTSKMLIAKVKSFRQGCFNCSQDSIVDILSYSDENLPTKQIRKYYLTSVSRGKDSVLYRYGASGKLQSITQYAFHTPTLFSSISREIIYAADSTRLIGISNTNDSFVSFQYLPKIGSANWYQTSVGLQNRLIWFSTNSPSISLWHLFDRNSPTKDVFQINPFSLTIDEILPYQIFLDKIGERRIYYLNKAGWDEHIYFTSVIDSNN